MPDGSAPRHRRPLRDQVAILHEGLGAAAEIIHEQQAMIQWLARFVVLSLAISAADRERRVRAAEGRARRAEQAVLDMMAEPHPGGFFDVEAGGRQDGVLVWERP
jgi:hypothetical protein